MEPEYAEEWDIVSSESDSVVLSVDFCCPECGELLSMITYAIGEDAVQAVIKDSDFEIDVVCKECGKQVTLVCDEANYANKDD